MIRQLSSFAAAAAAAAAGLALLAGAAAAQVEDPVKSTHGDWSLRCASDGQPCYLSQTLNGPDGEPLIDAIVRRVPGNEQVDAVASFRAPLGVLLPRGLEMRIDGSDPIRSPFLYCATNGCYVELAMTEDGLNRLRRGAAAAITVTSVQKPNEPVETRMSLNGFTAGFNALSN